jgi:hypothetical protein|tara:strand:- start:784 stop:981 length:198 start_codon:yes stop_codon:yes gene_type:complete
MLIIRREVTKTKSYTVIVCGDYIKKIPTNNYEHGEIMKIYKQDKPYQDVLNDFDDFDIGPKKKSE